MSYSRFKHDALGRLKAEVVAGCEVKKVLVMPRRKRARRVRLNGPCQILAFRRAEPRSVFDGSKETRGSSGV